MMQNNSESKVNQESIPGEQKCNYHEDDGDLLRYAPLQDDDDDGLSFQLEINNDPSLKIQPSPFRSKPDGHNENDDDVKFFFSEPSASETSSINTTPLTPNNYLKYDATYSPGGGNLSSNSLSPRRKGPLSPPLSPRRRVMFIESFKTQLNHESNNTPERDDKETTLKEKHDSPQNHLIFPLIPDKDASDGDENSNQLDPVTDVSNQDRSIVQNQDQNIPSNEIADSDKSTPSSKLTLTDHHRIQSLDASVSPESALYHSAVETPGSDNFSDENESPSADDNISYDDSSSVEETPDLSFDKIYDKYLVSTGQSTVVNEERQGLLASFDGETIDTTIVCKEDFMIQEEEKVEEENLDDLNSPESVKTTPFNKDHEGKNEETGNNPSISRKHIKELRIDPIDYISPTQREPSDAVTPIRSNSSEILKLKLTTKNIETPSLEVNKPVEHDETQDTQENANAASSADDEISVEVPYRKRIQSGEKKLPSHRRTRSGDEAAASLVTGGVDWIGMERTGLPLPAERGIRDDEDDSDENYEPNQAAISSYARRNSGSHKRSSYTKATESNSHKGQSRIRKHQKSQAVLSPHKSLGTLSVSYDSNSIESSSNFSWISNKVSLQSDKGNVIEKNPNDSHNFPTNQSDNSDNLLFPDIPFNTTIPTSNNTSDKAPPFSLNESTKGEDLFELNPKNTNLEWSAHESGSMFEANEAKDRMLEESNRHLSNYGAEYLISNQQSVSGSRKSQKYQTFTCPNCGSSQREFYTIDSAKHRSPSSFLVVYFALYIIAALFIFGMEEGWPPLECVYFSIITLTTTGLGDYVPTSDSAKIICSIFIYFGVACIGLVWGTLMASSLDDASRKSIRENLINNCETCLQRQSHYSMEEGAFQSFKSNTQLGTIVESHIESTGSWNNNLQSVSLSPVRQAHTRHLSLDQHDARNFLASEKFIAENEIRASSQSPHRPRLQRNYHRPTTSESDVYSFLSEASTASSDLLKPMSSIKAAKFVIITLRQAVANSIFVIAVGSLGFYFIEQLSAVDAFYFTTVLLTTVGYGDIVPTTSAGKLFASVYVLVAGTLLLHNMSMISMIPMEIRKRRLEQSVLLQFGDELDDAALRELASGSLVKRLQITDSSRAVRLDECTRETFALAMLVRLGRVSEQDIRLTYAAFQRLDKDNDGVLNSRDIILSEYERKLRYMSRRSSSNSTQPRGGGGGGSVTASIQQQQQHSRHSSYESIGFMEAQSHTRHSSRESVGGGLRSEKMHNMMNVNPSSEFHPLLGGKQNPSNHLMMRNEPASYMSIRNEGPSQDDQHDRLKNRNRSNSEESHISEVTVDVETGDLYNPFFR